MCFAVPFENLMGEDGKVFENLMGEDGIEGYLPLTGI